VVLWQLTQYCSTMGQWSPVGAPAALIGCTWSAIATTSNDPTPTVPFTIAFYPVGVRDRF
jgi:hypothetical protein